MLRFTTRTTVKTSSIRAIFDRIPQEAQKWKDKGGFINLSIGQPDIDPNPIVLEKIEQDKTNHMAEKLGYTPTAGEPETLEAIVRLYRQYYPQVQYNTSEVMVTNGATGALSNVFSALVEKKEDTVLTFEPFFAAYTGQINEWEGSLKIIPTRKQRFRPTPDILRSALQSNPSARALIMNYPNNPSGVSLDRKEIEGLVEVLREFPDIWVIIDDVYRDFDFREHCTVLDVAPDFKDRSIVINSGAKGLIGAPGYRIGMVATHKDLIKAMIPRQINGLASVPHATQRALLHAANVYIENPENTWQTNAKKSYQTKVEEAGKAFKSQGFTIEQEPEGAFYLLVNASMMIGKLTSGNQEPIRNDIDIANYFMEVAGVAVVPASGFGIAPEAGLLRVSCAKSVDQLVSASERMGKAIKNNF